MGTDGKRISVNDTNLPKIKGELEAFKGQIAEASVIAVVDTILVVVLVAIEGWNLYRAEQDRAERAKAAQDAKDEAARQNQEKERIKNQQEIHSREATERTCHEVSAGGPATDRQMERISRTA